MAVFALALTSATGGWFMRRNRASLDSRSVVIQETASSETPAHVESGFEFSVHAPYQSVVPLFGGLGERCWGGEEWTPQFVYPMPANDKVGEVFTLTHGHLRSTWINTALDLKAGHISYVYFIPDALSVLVDINVRPRSKSDTAVKVSYHRTALRPELNSHIAELSRKDREMGQHWASAISACLMKSK